MLLADALTKEFYTALKEYIFISLLETDPVI